MPSLMQVERGIQINAPVDSVFKYVNTLKLWEQWSPWHKMDGDMKIDYSATTSGTGAYYTWKSNNKNVGNGKLTIIESTTNQLVKTTMDFGDDGTGTAIFKFESAGGSTRITWNMESEMGKNPFMKLMGPMMESMIGQSFDEGLKSLKQLCEKK